MSRKRSFFFKFEFNLNITRLSEALLKTYVKYHNILYFQIFYLKTILIK